MSSFDRIKSILLFRKVPLHRSVRSSSMNFLPFFHLELNRYVFPPRNCTVDTPPFTIHFSSFFLFVLSFLNNPSLSVLCTKSTEQRDFYDIALSHGSGREQKLLVTAFIRLFVLWILRKWKQFFNIFVNLAE